MKKEVLNEVEKVFNLNECAIMRSCYDRTEANMAIRRSARPFINPINKAMQEASVLYNAKAKELIGDKEPKDLSQEELKEFSEKMNVEIYKINSNIYPKIDLSRDSSLNFFIRFWTQFSFNHEVDGEFTMRQADEIDAKIVELHPDLGIDLDNKEEVKEDTKKEDNKKTSK